MNVVTGLFLVTQLFSAGFAQKPGTNEPGTNEPGTKELGAKELGSVLHLADRVVPNAKLVSVQEAQWGFKIHGKEEPEQYKLAAITRWGSWRGVIGKQALWLSDGSWLVGEIQLDTKDQIQLQSRWLQIGSIPTKSIRAMLISPMASQADWIALQQSLLNYSGESDSVWLRDRKQVVGVIQTESLSSRSTMIEVSASNQSIKIPLDQVAVVAFSPTLHGPISNDPPVQIGLRDGTMLSGRSIKSANNQVEVMCQSGIKVQSLDFPDDFLSSIVYLSCPIQENVQRLDLLKPASYKHIPDSSLEFSLGVNKDVFGQPLITGSRRKAGMVFHGLAMHSSSQVAFRWDGSTAKLIAEAQLSATSPDNTQAVCKVLLARDGQLTTASEFTLSRRVEAEQIRLLEMDISKSQLIVLVVEKGTQSQFGDHVLWLDPRIVKQ
ncbi:MAG: NPCBM/NEW2 domain-containing protein [Pirellulales bacterium]